MSEELDLGPIEERMEAATPGPWVVSPAWPNAYLVEVAGTGYRPDLTLENSLFIAHARTDVPALVAEVKRLREALAARDGDQ